MSEKPGKRQIIQSFLHPIVKNPNFFNLYWNKTDISSKYLAFYLINYQINQLSKSLLINFRSIDQLCQHKSPWRWHVWRRLGHTWLRVKHHFLSVPVSRLKGQFGARVTERLRQRVTHWPRPRSAFQHYDQRFMATHLPALSWTATSMANRGMFTSTQQPCRQSGVHQISAGWVGGRGGIKCLQQRLTIGF